MASIIAELRDKIRSLVGDFLKTDTEVFTYENSGIFTLQEENIQEVTEVTLNGSDLASGDYTFDTSNNKLTITVSGLASGDIIEVIYTYYKYNNTEIDGYIKSALVWFSVFDASPKDFEIENEDIFPTPDNQEEDMIALIASIIIKPNYNEYRLPNLTVKYPRKFSKEEKIERLLNRWTRGLGVNDTLDFN